MFFPRRAVSRRNCFRSEKEATQAKKQHKYLIEVIISHKSTLVNHFCDFILAF